MKEGIAAPARVVDIRGLPLGGIDADAAGLRLGALARMSDVAAHPVVAADYPVLAESLLRAASPQLRNMATLGGNLMQRTRCPYFRAEVELPATSSVPVRAVRHGMERPAGTRSSGGTSTASPPIRPIWRWRSRRWTR